MAYIPTGIVHNVNVDIGNIRSISSVVKLTQGDKTSPVIAAKIYNGTSLYTIPEDATVSIRMSKPDGKAVYNAASGTDGSIAYFEVSEQMAAAAGDAEAIIEIMQGDNVVGSGIFKISFTKNPVWDGSDLSESELGVLQGFVDTATEASETATQKASEAADSATQAAASQTAANNSAINAANSATAAEEAANNAAKDFENSITALETAKGENLNIDDSASDQLYGLQIYGKATQGGTPSPETQIPIDVSGSDGSVSLSFVGNNLFDVSKFESQTVNGVTITNNGDGSITISGSGNMVGSLNNLMIDVTEEILPILKVGILHANYGAVTYPYAVLKIMDENNSMLIQFTNQGSPSVQNQITEYILSKAKKVYLQIYGASGNPIVGGTIKPMVYQNGDGTWEPYTGQTFTVSTPNGLPGVPVTSGENYTDETGQKWLSDFIDCNLGKRFNKVIIDVIDHVDRVNSYKISAFSYNVEENHFPGLGWNQTQPLINSAGLQNIEFNDIDTSTNCISVVTTNTPNQWCYAIKISGIDQTLEGYNQYLAQNPITVITIAGTATQKETDMSAEEIAAYKALMTNEGTTNVSSGTNPQVGIVMKYRNNRTLSDNIVEIVESRTDVVGYRPNLLVNGDFQISQRGNSFSNVENNTYTLDMWRCYSVGSPNFSVEVVSDGVKFTGVTSDCYFNQNVDTSDYIGEDYIITYSRDGIIYTKSGSISEASTTISLYIPSDCTLNWARMDIGSFAYPHVKEDYAIALERCRHFIKAGTSAGHLSYNYGSNMKYRIYFDKPFIQAPTVSIIGAGYISNSGSWNDASNITSIEAETGLFSFNAETPNLPSGVESVSVSYVASIEPL